MLNVLYKEIRVEKIEVQYLLLFYIKTWQTKKSWSCAQQLMELTTNTEERATLFVRLGCIGEQMSDYAMAESFYRDSLRIGARGFMREYWAYNNLGYCLNQLGRPAEAQPYLNRAITLDPTRSNAFKNLGLCYQGLERFPDAVEMFIEATRANATDDRSLVHLDALIESYPALYEQVPELDVKVKMCRDAVDSARSMQPDFDDWWRNRRTKQDTENEDQTYLAHADDGYGCHAGCEASDPPALPQLMRDALKSRGNHEFSKINMVESAGYYFKNCGEKPWASFLCAVSDSIFYCIY